MLQQSKSMPQLQEWRDKLAPVVNEARETLRQIKPDELALRSGCERDADGDFRLTFMGQEYIVSGADFTVRWAGSGDAAPSYSQSLILTYMVTADGTPSSDHWIGFRDLPDGMFYVRAFQAYTGARIVRELEGGIEAFRRAASKLEGEPLEIGDAGYAFTILPRVRMALVYWEGDEEFPSQARVLFEESAAHYMCADGLAIMGSQLVGRLLKARP